MRLMEKVWQNKIAPSNALKHTLLFDKMIIEKILAAKLKFSPQKKRLKELWVQLYEIMLDETNVSRNDGANEESNYGNCECTAYEMFFFPRVCAIIPFEE
jgi:hypothetical protein